mmetsp:Transcript_30157/g.115671  ORF Transcript_30157/g.115671 Transcript_30157/m.115671 type:complete len:714 (-) Transcript_30157:1544-3685(-)
MKLNRLIGRFTGRRRLGALQRNDPDSVIVLPTPRRVPDELGVLAGTVSLALNRHGAKSVGFFRAADGGGFDSVGIIKDKYEGVRSRSGIAGQSIVDGLSGSTDHLVESIADSYERFRKDNQGMDFVVLEGFWLPGHSDGFMHEVNSKLATRLGCNVIANVDCQEDSKVSVASYAEELVRELRRRLVHVTGVILVGGSGRGLRKFMESRPFPFAGLIPKDKLLSSPTFSDLRDQLDADVLCGTKSLEGTVNSKKVSIATGYDVRDVMVERLELHKTSLIRFIHDNGGLVSIEELEARFELDKDVLTALDVDKDGMIREEDIVDYSNATLIVTSFDRTDILLSVFLSELSVQDSGKYSGVIVSSYLGGSGLKEIVDNAAEAYKLRLGSDHRSLPPVMGVKTALHATVKNLRRVTPQLSKQSERKIDRTIENFRKFVDPDVILQSISQPKSQVVTPSMFQHQFLQRAAKKQRRIVLPEGTEPRILLAAQELLRKHVADIVLLGNEQEIRSVAGANAIEINGAEIIDPNSSSRTQKYVEEFVKLRRKKGATVDMAKDALQDMNYFGTMMVQCGDADGMVSGSINTTAATVRPALQLIKTKENISIVSSVFFMCLPDKVLVYGDCAINPKPTSSELSQIAVTSAHTAAQFGITPTVAMLSFSSGDRATSPEVRLVSEAVKLARKLDPELKIYGPIQYDAAVSPSCLHVSRQRRTRLDA